MKTIIGIIVIFTITETFSQTVYDGTLNYKWDFYANNYLNGIATGRGNTGIGINNSISSSALNPATLDIGKSKYEAFVQYNVKTSNEINYNSSFTTNTYQLKNNIFSGSAGIAFKINKSLTAGLIYSNPRSMRIDFGQVIRTNEFGDTLGTFESINRYEVHSIAAPMSIIYKNFSAGLTISYSYYKAVWENGTYSDGTESNYTGIAKVFNAQFGILIRLNKDFSFGATLTPQIKADSKYSESNGTAGGTETIIYPWKFGAGISAYIPGTKIKTLADINYELTSVLTGYKDRVDFNFGIELPKVKNLAIAAGIFTFRQITTFPIDPGNSLSNTNQTFLTAGLSYQIKNVLINANILDSHISSGKIKNTFINTGINVGFGKQK